MGLRHGRCAIHRPWLLSLLAVSSPLLILLALAGLVMRHGAARVTTLPALLIGMGLLIASAVQRRRRRHRILLALRQDGSSPVESRP